MAEKKYKHHTTSTNNLDLYLIVFEQIKLGLNPSQIAQKLNWKKQRIAYYTRKLEELGLIKKIGYGTWKEVQTSYPYGLTSYPPKKKEIRSHGFRFTLKIPDIPLWKNREEFLKKANLPYKHIPQGYRIDLDYYSSTFKVWLCDKSIVVHFPSSKSYLVHSAHQGYSKAIYDFLKIINKLEGTLNISLQIKKKYQFQVSKRHHSNINNALAKQYNKTKNKLNVRDEEGRLWLLIDNSFNLHELEVVSSSGEDSAETLTDDVVVNFFNQTKETKLMPNQILLMFKHTGEAINNLSNILEKEIKKMSFYNDNFVKHIDVLDQMGKAVTDLKDAVSLIQPERPEDLIKYINKADDLFTPEMKQRINRLPLQEKSRFTDMFIQKLGGDKSGNSL